MSERRDKMKSYPNAQTREGRKGRERINAEDSKQLQNIVDNLVGQ